MAGHSKWANIKHKKARQDAKRGKVFTKLIREITVSARLGGGEPADNPRLRLVMDKALAANMPKDTIERAIERGVGAGDGSSVEELTYEGYGPGGVAILVEAMTDNRNRTVAEVRHAFSKHGGNLGTDGSVAYLFSKQGVINFGPGADPDRVMEVALEAGAEDIDLEEDDSISVVTPWDQLGSVAAALTAAGMPPEHAEVAMVPGTTVPCDDEQAEAVLKLIDALEELDDVQNVYSNGDYPDSVLDA
ncbi:MAG: YebC/PmpR family DNA-binding transcriptional regulator [Pseudomonadales bacterium]